MTNDKPQAEKLELKLRRNVTAPAPGAVKTGVRAGRTQVTPI